MLMLKFGRLVDLEKLENVTVNRTVEELKEKLRQQESKSAAEIAKWNVRKTSLFHTNIMEHFRYIKTRLARGHKQEDINKRVIQFEEDRPRSDVRLL